ncbi:MAG: OpgC family protein [Alphaproteobacteria bacterium]
MRRVGMNAAEQVSGSSGGGTGAGLRDLRLDFFRGLALFSIFVDHIPNNVMARFTLQSVALADAAEVFILISGYVAGMVYGRAVDRQGALTASARIYHRVWQLYVAHVFLFMLFMAAVAHAAASLNAGLYADEFRAADFLKQPDVAVIMALTLRFQPAFMDILPVYIVLLAALPIALLGMRRWPAVVLGLSFALWLAVQFKPELNLAAYPGIGQVWYFNPFAWQALFFFSAWLGWRSTRGGVAWLTNRWLFWAAVGIAAAGFVIRVNWTLHWLHDPIPALFAQTLWPLMSKTDLSPLRFANVLALALLVARLVPPQAGFLAGPLAKPFVMCGRHSLHIFCLGILLSVVGHLIINEHFGGVLLQTTVTAAGIAAMIGVAGLMDWFAAASRSSRARVAGERS